MTRHAGQGPVILSHRCHRVAMPIGHSNGGPKPKGGHRLPVRIPDGYWEETELRARAAGVSLSDYIAAALMKHIDSTPRPAIGQAELFSRQEVLNKSA